jgi:hypothetical protein
MALDLSCAGLGGGGRKRGVKPLIAGLENAVAGLKRFRVLEERDINRETFVESWPEAGLMVADSPYDPAPSIRIVDGRIVELDGRQEEDTRIGT